MAHLILVRHGKSKWNELGLWTGLTDVELNDTGKEEARLAGASLKDIEIHHAYTSLLKRTHQTFEEIAEVLGLKVKPVAHHALNERDYGIHTGKNKWQVKDEIGEEIFQRIRRSWDEPIPNGETLKDVHARVAPYYDKVIKTHLKSGENVLVVAHGNTLRALIKHLEGLSDAEICDVEVGTGEAHLYHIDHEGKVKEKEVRAANSNKSKT